MKGYCWLHNTEYKLNHADDICPRCLHNKEQDLEWRTDEDLNNEA